MKLLVNKNCSGYHWFGCELIGDEQYLKMYEEQSVNQVSSYLGGLRIYGQFEYCLIRDKDTYLLAINNLQEKKKDVFDRSISIKMIFIGDKDNAQLLLKILLTAIEDFDSFSERMNLCFDSSSMSHPIYVRCNWKELRSFIQKIEKKVLTPATEKILDDLSMRLILVSDESIAMGRNGLGFSDKEIHKAKENSKALDAGKFFQTTLSSGTEKDIKQTDESETQDKSESGQKTEEVKENNIEYELDSSRNESEKEDLSEKKSEITWEKAELQNKLNSLNERNADLERELGAVKLQLEQLRTILKKKCRLYKSLLTISGALIVTILIILYILK